MSRNNGKKSDILSGAGALFEGYRILKDEFGVTDADWRRMLSDDKRYAAQVAEALRAVAPIAASLDELIAAAKASRALTCVNEKIISANFPETAVRDGLVLVDLKLRGWFSTEKALDTIDSLGYHPAPMIEGAAFADDGWDRKTSVGILGSVLRDSDGCGYVGCLWAYGARRELGLRVGRLDWSADYRFLAVPKKVKK